MPPTSAPALEPHLLEVWKKYEDIAMHFNDLIMRWRLQAMGGLATLVTIGGFVANAVGYRYSSSQQSQPSSGQGGHSIPTHSRAFRRRLYAMLIAHQHARDLLKCSHCFGGERGTKPPWQ